MIGVGWLGVRLVRIRIRDSPASEDIAEQARSRLAGVETRKH